MDIANKIKSVGQGGRRPKKKSDLTVSHSVTSVVDTLSFEEKIQSLEEDLIEARKAMHRPSVTLKMPISSHVIELVEEEVDPDLIDISPVNRRDQEMLTLASVSDIFPSIRQTQQNKPGLLRSKEDGRYELIGGSRRLFCARNIPGRKFLALVGPILDEDIKALEREDNHSLPISDFEIGQHFFSLIDDFATENEFYEHYAKIEGKSPATIRRITNLGRLPKWFVKCFHTPNDIPKTKISWVIQALKSKEHQIALKKRADTLVQKNAELYEKVRESPDPDSVLKELRKSIQINKSIGKKQAEVMKNLRGDSVGVHRVKPDGTHVFELKRLSREKLNSLQEFLKDLLN